MCVAIKTKERPWGCHRHDTKFRYTTHMLWFPASCLLFSVSFSERKQEEQIYEDIVRILNYTVYNYIQLL